MSPHMESVMRSLRGEPTPARYNPPAPRHTNEGKVYTKQGFNRGMWDRWLAECNGADIRPELVAGLAETRRQLGAR